MFAGHSMLCPYDGAAHTGTVAGGRSKRDSSTASRARIPPREDKTRETPLGMTALPKRLTANREIGVAGKTKAGRMADR